MPWVWLPGADLSEDEQKRLYEQALRSWVLYGEIHLTNAPRGQGYTLNDPTRYTYRPQDAPSDLGQQSMGSTALGKRLTRGDTP